MPSKDIYYSDKYSDDTHEYRHVILPKVEMRIILLKTSRVTCSVYVRISPSWSRRRSWWRRRSGGASGCSRALAGSTTCCTSLSLTSSSSRELWRPTSHSKRNEAALDHGSLPNLFYHNSSHPDPAFSDTIIEETYCVKLKYLIPVTFMKYVEYISEIRML